MADRHRSAHWGWSPTLSPVKQLVLHRAAAAEDQGVQELVFVFTFAAGVFIIV